MDVFERDGGTSTADTVHRREEFRQIVSDVGELPETQRTALLLREIDALSYDQIAEAMDTTVPSVKSLLVRARVSLAEAAEARLLTCEEVQARARPGGRGPHPHHRAAAAPPQDAATAAAPSASSCARRTARSPPSTRSGRSCFFKKLWLAKAGFGGAGAAGAAAGVAAPPPGAAAWPAWR